MACLRSCALVILASLFWFGPTAAAEQPSAAQMMDDLMYGRGSVGGPFTLIDQTGKQRSDAEFRGKLMIVYFGYTYCPDVCPTDLMAITQALDALGSGRGRRATTFRHDRSGKGQQSAWGLCVCLPSQLYRTYGFPR